MARPSNSGLGFTAAQRCSIHNALAKWYRNHGRDLPWKSERNPYRVWLREIMLQQTTVAAVIPYLERFLDRFPDVQSLAAADETDVLRLWEGLGYYSRARNLHRAAGVLVNEYTGRLPESVAALETLPGIGRYTAGAIASFAFDIAAAIIEANTLRLHTRLLGYEGDPRLSDGQRVLWEWAQTLADSREKRRALTRNARAEKDVRLSPGELNQALMDLGATVCTPTEPDCPACPLKRWCRAFAKGLQQELPRLRSRPEVTRVTEATVAVRHRGRYLLRRRPAGERWAGLWDFPRFAIADSQSIESALVAGVRAQSGLIVEPGPQIAQFQHGVTRYRITLRCFTATLHAGRLNDGSESAWVKPIEFARYPFSVTGRKFATLLSESLFG